MTRVVIVGASVAGIRTAQALRMQGFDGSITLIGEELHHPYDKPPLSKEQLADEASDTAPPLLSGEELQQLDVELLLGARATGLDPVTRVVHTSGGDHSYDFLVIATGVSPRTLPGADIDGVRTIRTADDAIYLRSRLAARPRVVIVGAGFIGAEFAAAANAQGCDVTIIEAQQTPLAHLLGEQVGECLAQLHQNHGVTVRTGVRFERFVGDSHVEGVALADGEILPADLVVVGIGATPATDWLSGSGLPLDDGVECEENLQVVGYPGVFAAGDAARWPHAHYDGQRIRVEHWTNANEHGAIVAAAITSSPAPRTQPPYVWSDQYGHRIQIVGRPSLGTLAHITGDGPENLQALYADANGTLIGAVVVDDPRALMKLRKALTKGSAVVDVAPAPAAG